jgi:hypothetical protein
MTALSTTHEFTGRRLVSSIYTHEISMQGYGNLMHFLQPYLPASTHATHCHHRLKILILVIALYFIIWIKFLCWTFDPWPGDIWSLPWRHLIPDLATFDPWPGDIWSLTLRHLIPDLATFDPWPCDIWSLTLRHLIPDLATFDLFNVFFFYLQDDWPHIGCIFRAIINSWLQAQILTSYWQHCPRNLHKLPAIGHKFRCWPPIGSIVRAIINCLLLVRSSDTDLLLVALSAESS